jgi:hypothetical protein
MVDGDHGRHGENGIAVLLIAERKDQVHRQKPDHDPECQTSFKGFSKIKIEN